MIENKRIILVGKAASGKDHFRKKLENRGFKYSVTYTTRPKRQGEVDGADYSFIDQSAFESLLNKVDYFYEWVKFNEWYYGTPNHEWNNSDIFIMTPSGVSKIKPEDRKSSFIIYIDIPIEIRKQRLSLRNDADSVDRRIEADENDFKEFTDFDIRITDHNF